MNGMMLLFLCHVLFVHTTSVLIFISGCVPFISSSCFYSSTHILGSLPLRLMLLYRSTVWRWIRPLRISSSLDVIPTKYTVEFLVKRFPVPPQPLHQDLPVCFFGLLVMKWSRFEMAGQRVCNHQAFYQAICVLIQWCVLRLRLYIYTFSFIFGLVFTPCCPIEKKV